MKLAIVNGPNLNLLGTREPDQYGNQTFEAYYNALVQKYTSIEFCYYQNNVEGEIVNELQRLSLLVDGIIINPAAYTHTSVAIGDAIAAIKPPVIEVHISNIHAREDFRKLSHVSAKCKGTISGFGMKGYELAVQSFLLP